MVDRGLPTLIQKDYMTNDEKLMQKALGTYPTATCIGCNKIVYTDEVDSSFSTINGNRYFRCNACFERLTNFLRGGKLSREEYREYLGSTNNDRNPY
jgi:NAD-dependent SIR2 family protein deacetylase